jgi:hypothetical protein
LGEASDVIEDPERRPLRTVRRCLLCGHTPIDATVDGRFVTTSCPVCRATLAVEFDPPDQPGLRARIDRMHDSSDTRRRVIMPPKEVFACDRGRRIRRRSDAK